MLIDAVAHPYTTVIARAVVGGLLLVAGVTKLFDRPGLAQTVEQYGVLPQSIARPFARLLPWVEVAVGAMLLLGLWTRASAGAAVVLLGAFSVTVGINLARDRDLECHCFGNLHRSRISRVTLVRNLLLTLLAIQPLFIGGTYLAVDAWLRGAEPRDSPSDAGMIAVALVVVCLAVSWLLARGLWLLLRSPAEDEVSAR